MQAVRGASARSKRTGRKRRSQAVAGPEVIGLLLQSLLQVRPGLLQLPRVVERPAQQEVIYRTRRHQRLGLPLFLSRAGPLTEGPEQLRPALVVGSGGQTQLPGPVQHTQRLLGLSVTLLRGGPRNGGQHLGPGEVHFVAVLDKPLLKGRADHALPGWERPDSAVADQVE